jgi:hypothetical protein
MTKHSMHGTLIHQCTHDRTLLPIKTGVHCTRIAPVLGWMLLRAKGPYSFSFSFQPSVFFFKYVKHVTSFVTGIGYFMVAVQQYCISELSTSWRLSRNSRSAVSSLRVRLSDCFNSKAYCHTVPCRFKHKSHLNIWEHSVYRSVNTASPLQRPIRLFWESYKIYTYNVRQKAVFLEVSAGGWYIVSNVLHTYMQGYVKHTACRIPTQRERVRVRERVCVCVCVCVRARSRVTSSKNDDTRKEIG